MNLQVDNPVCILNQETAKNFLHSNDAKQKYKLFERATQMDVMHHEFSIAEDELSRSKSCMKEKLQVNLYGLNQFLNENNQLCLKTKEISNLCCLQSLELLKSEVTKWRIKKEWYEAINEIHEKKAKIENEIAWAQVEDLEKRASEAFSRKENQKSAIEEV